MKIIESGISPVIGCGGCGLPTTYHKYDDGKTLFRCDFCDQIVAKMWTATDD